MPDILETIAFSLGVLSIGALLSFGYVKAIESKHIIGFVLLCSINYIILFSLLMLWFLYFGVNVSEGFGIFYLSSITLSGYLFILLSNFYKFKKKYKGFQLGLYIPLTLFLVFLEITIISDFDIDPTEITLSLAIISIVMFIILQTKRKSINQEKITISLEEYNYLLNRIKELESK